MEIKDVNETSKWERLDDYILRTYRPMSFQAPRDIESSIPGSKAVFRQKKMARGRAYPKEMPHDLLSKSNMVALGIKKDRDLDSLLNQKNETFQEMLFRLIDEKNYKDSYVYTKSNIDRRLFSKIRSDSDYHPSKETVILLCFGLELEIDLALAFLNKAGYSLSFSKKEDIVVRFFLNEKNYDIQEVNQALFDHDLKLLFK